MKNLKILLLAIVALFAFSCEDEVEAPGTNYVTFEKTDYTFEVTPDGTTTRDIYVYSANFSGSERTFNVNILDESTADPSIYTVPGTVTIPANSNVGTFTVTATDGDLDFSNPETVVVEIQGENGLSVGEKMTINLLKECIYTQVFLSLSFDGYAEECVWEIYDLADTSAPILSGGQGSEYTALDNDSLNLTFCLQTGNYGIIVYDTYGDGGTTYEVSAGGNVLASGSSVDAGGGYPVLTQTSSTFAIN